MTDIQKQLAEAFEQAAEEIERSHTWIGASAASAIVRKHAKVALAAHRQQEARGPLTEEQLWDLKDKHLWKAYTAREWVKETDYRSGYYKEVQRGYDDFIGFARAIEAAHGIKGE